ncbi:hypothetical protein CO641_11800 [Lysobacteraceae bacterium NML91-0213]|nr:hypothetical protein CO641_11800 [Xanthomonadaceae bacterium NML91-0213]
MKNAWLALLLLQTACAPETVLDASLPGDVSRFIERRDLCDHFRGEIPDPDDHRRMAGAVSNISRYCTGTDAELALLRARYIDSPRVRQLLAGYETKIEADPD